MGSITQTDPTVKKEISAVIRDWQRRRNVTVRSMANARRNAIYILRETAAGGWATEYVLDMVQRAGFATVSAAEVQAVASELAGVAK